MLGIGTAMTEPIYCGDLSAFNSFAIDESGQNVELKTESPAWFAALVDVDSEFNYLSFDYQFLSDAEGWLPVSFNGEVIFDADERYTAEELITQIVFLGENYSPGTFHIGFRLDPFGDVQSRLTISNVRFGLFSSCQCLPRVG